MTTENLEKLMTEYGRAITVHYNHKPEIQKFAFACNNIARHCIQNGKIKESEQKQAVRFMLEEYNMGCNPQFPDEYWNRLAEVIINDKSIEFDVNLIQKIEIYMMLKSSTNKSGKIDLDEFGKKFTSSF